MKNLRLIALLSFLLVGFVGVQAQNIGHINSQAVLEAMPAFKDAQTKLEAEAARHKAEVERQQNEMQTILTNAQTQMESVKNKSEAEQRAMMQKLAPVQQDLQQKQQALMDYQKTAAESLNKKETEMIKPLYEKVQNAINAVGATQKLTYIFDMAVMGPSGALVYANGSKDLTEAVKKQLGL